MDESNHKKKYMDAAMYIAHVSEDVRQSYKSLLWTIRTYNELKLNTVYECYDTNINWHLFIKKETECVKISVKSKDLSNIICSLVCDDNEILYSVSATEVSKGIYEFEFPSSAIKDPRNKPLKKSHLCISFKFNEIPEIRKVYAQNPKKKCISDQLRLMKDLQYFAVKQKLTRNANAECALIPRALVAARSECSVRKKSVEVDASKESVHIAEEYLYTGVLPVFLKSEDIQELLDVAKMLKIKSLELKCLHLAQKLHK